MKKLLLSLAVLAFAFSAFAEDPIASIEFKKNSEAYASTSSYSSEWESTDKMWKFQGFNNNNRGWDFIAAGWKTDNTTPYVASGVPCPLPVSSIVFNIGDRFTENAITSAKLLVSDNADFSNATETAVALPTAKNSEWVVNVAKPAANKYYKVQLEIPKQSSNGQAISLTKIALYQNPYKAEEPKPSTYTKVSSIAQVKALKSGDKVEVDFPMTVAFVKNSNVFVTDAAGDFIQIYGANSYKVNDVVPAGWKAEYELYQTYTPELKPESLPASTSTGNFVAKVVAADKVTVDLVNSVVTIKDVVFDKDTPSAKENFTGTVGATTLSFRNNYELTGVAAGKYDVTVVVTVYNGAPSLYVINYGGAAGVGEITVDDAAEAVYYNLQGVKVAEPANGVFIKVQGKKATKVYVGK